MAKFAITTLKNRCFDVLAENMDTLIEDLDNGNKGALERLIQRNWSDDLFRRLKGPLRERHALFFINAHLKELAFQRFSSAEIEQIIQILKAQGEGIWHLSLTGSVYQRYLEVTVLHLAESLPSSLTHLRFENVECSDASLSIVARNCPNLQKLHLTNCKGVTNCGIDALFSKEDGSLNTVMQFLDLRGTSVSECGILMALGHCPNMTELVHPRLNYAINFAYQYCLHCRVLPSRTYNLKTLTISLFFWGLNLTPLHFLRPWQMLCPGVHKLSVSRLQTQTELDICGNFQDLKSVALDSLKPLLLSSFLEIRGSELKRLRVIGNIIVSIDSVIKCCPNLESLKLRTPRFGNYVAGKATKYSLQNLRTLQISFVDIAVATREMAALFHSSPNLEKLMFWHVTGFTDDLASLITMHDVVNLRYLQVLRCDIDTSILKKIIMASPSLTHVSITLCDNISHEKGKDLDMLRDGLTISYKGEATPNF